MYLGMEVAIFSLNGRGGFCILFCLVFCFFVLFGNFSLSYIHFHHGKITFVIDYSEKKKAGFHMQFFWGGGGGCGVFRFALGHPFHAYKVSYGSA